MLDGDWNIKMIDFGDAKHECEPTQDDSDESCEVKSDTDVTSI